MPRRSLSRIGSAAFVAAGLGLAGLPALSADADGNFAIKGAGVQTCSKFLADWDAAGQNMALYAGWIEGYATGLNQHTENTYDLIPWQTTDTLLGMMRLYCGEEHGETRFIDRFVALMRDLAPLRLAARSDVGAIRHGDRAMIIYHDVLRAVEGRLNQEGFPVSAGDDVYTRDTALALEAFQQQRGLAVTGLPDQRTLLELFLNPGNDADGAGSTD
ncbi:MAG: peptidoglycan-binding protein [Rhodospirillales bacterium]|nr:MAG: peptidoglycan-binding protein [Rhodospirillales bacterium]